MKLIDMVVTDYLNIVASDAPAPGGGSAAAFCGAQGTGLVTMVAGQTAVKKRYEAGPSVTKLLSRERRFTTS